MPYPQVDSNLPVYGDEADSQRPITNDAELAREILKVSGSTAEEKKLVLIRSRKTGKITGYKYVHKPNPFEEILDEDMTKGNLDGRELEIVRIHANFSNAVQEFSKQLDMDFTPIQRFLARQLKAIAVSSRAKSGWAVTLTKTDKTVNEQNLVTLQRQQQIYEDKKKEGILAKIFGKPG